MGGRPRRGELSLASLSRPHRAGLENGARTTSVLAGALLIGAGLLHISAAGDHTNLPVMLAGFLVVATLQAGLGGLLLFRRPGKLLVAGGLALTLGALGMWLLSRTAGLPFLPGGHMEAIGFKDGVTVLFEVGTVPALAILASSELDQVRLPSARLGSQAVAVLGAGMFALFVPAFTLGGGEHHSQGEMAAHAHGEDGGDHPHGGDETAHASTGDGHGHAKGSGHGDAGHGHGEGGKGGHGDGEHADDGDHPHDGSELASLTPDDHAHGGDGEHKGAGHGNGGAGHGHQQGDGHDENGHGEDGHGDGQDDGSGHRGGDHGHENEQGGGGGGHGHGDGHGDGGHDDGHAAEAPDNERALALESGHPADEGRGARGPALVFHDKPNEEMNGSGHAHTPCNPTPAQQAAADTIAREVQTELKQYENNPAAALMDGFNYAFGPTDRMLHMVHLGRMSDPTVLKATEIESFIYYMTDTGFVPIGGMFVMPNADMPAPEPGGCLTRWHHHGGVVGRWATAGTSDRTPPMMHVFTYPGLDPWGHYNGRDLAPLWMPGRWLPSVCRESGDANDGCLP